MNLQNIYLITAVNLTSESSLLCLLSSVGVTVLLNAGCKYKKKYLEGKDRTV